MVLAHHGTVTSGALVHDQTSTTRGFLATKTVSDREFDMLMAESTEHTKLQLQGCPQKVHKHFGRG